MRTFICKRIKITLLATLLLFSNTFYSANVIFDLGGVLVSPNKMYMVRQIGFYSFLLFLLNLNNPFSLQHRLATALEHVPAKTENVFGATDGKGNNLSNIMCDWLTGAQSSKQLRQQVLTYFQDNPLLFYNRAEKRLFSQITTLTFTPEAFAKSINLIKDGVKFVKRCKEQGHNIFVLSNWDKESFSYLREAQPELFSLFEDQYITISGQIGLMKPDPDIYEYIIQKYNLIPRECIFFDDQEENIKTAQTFGIHTVLCKHMSYEKMENALDSFTQKINGTYIETSSCQDI